MGGSSYERDVYSSSSASAWSGSFGSEEAKEVFRSTNISSDMFPRGRMLKSNTKTPIVIMLDVTGSNIDFARIVYDKMPMFYGQIEQQNYLEDFDVAVCAVGDAYEDKYPLQVPEFGAGIEIDAWLKKLVLEGGGGSTRKESYELAAYYLAKNFQFREDAEPIVFFIADEDPYDKVNSEQVEKYVGQGGYTETEKPFAELAKRISNRLFLILNPLCGREMNEDVYNSWRSVIDEKNIVRFKTGQEKSVVDTILGIIALSYGSRSLAGYKEDMVKRGQTQERIGAVSDNLAAVSAVQSVPKLKGLAKLFSLGSGGSSGGSRL